MKKKKERVGELSGEKLRIWMHRKQLTQAALGELLGGVSDKVIRGGY